MSSDFIEVSSIHPIEERQPVRLGCVSKAAVWLWADRIFLVSSFCAILFVSLVDTWFASMNEYILLVEANPLCEWLIRLAPGSCGYFVAGKILGTILVMLALYGLLRFKYRHARLVIAAVALFQLGLLSYLCFSDPKMDNWINLPALFDEKEESIIDVLFTIHNHAASKSKSF